MSFKVGRIAMKQRKNVLLTLLVFLLCFLVTFSLADGKSADFEYKILDDGTIEITKYIGSTSYIDFPSEIDGHTISSIGASAFEGSSKLQKIYYFNETSVTVIGDCAFKECTALKYIDIPESLTSIGDSAFEGCSSMEKAYYLDSSAVTSIGKRAFFGCTALKYIDIPAGLTTVHESSFEGCTSMEKAYYMDASAVTSFENRAFYGCTALKYIDIPQCAITINESAFEGCTDLDKIYYLGDSSVTKIGKNAFKGCADLQYFDAPATLTEIGESAFEGCTSLKHIYYLNENNVSFGVNAFANCPSLKDMPKGATVDASKLSATSETPSPAPTVAATEIPTVAITPSNPDGWICPNCGYDAIGNFCNNCGNPRPKETITPEQNTSDDWVCPNCGYKATGNFCNNCGGKRSENVASIEETGTPEPTSTPKPTVQPAPTAKWTGDVKTLSSGTYYVGSDLPAGTYLFRQIEGDDYVPVIYVYNSDQEKVDSGSADKNGCVLNLKDGQIIKVGWTKAYVSLFDTTWTENETRTLPSGTYYVGTDIPAGSYQFVKIAGDDYTPVLYVYNADNLSEKVDSGNASDTGCALNLKEGQVLKITWTAAIASKLDLEWTEGEKTLPAGTYYIGTDLPAGVYHFKHIEGDDYTPVLYVYNADNLKEKIDSANASDVGCILSLKDGQVLKITWTATITSKFDTAFSNGETKLLPSGTYYIGTDLPAGTYSFKPIQGDDYTPVLYVYNADNLEKRIDSASVYSSGCSLNLKDGQVLKIAWTGTYATLSNSAGMTSDSSKSTTKTSVTATPKPEPEPTEKATEVPVTKEPEQTSKSDDSLESVVAYMLSPNDSSLRVNVVELGEGSFTASAAGKSYYGYYFAEDDSYMIEMALTGSGSYDYVDSPFDYTSSGFKQLLNFLLKKNGRTVASVYPILGDIYGTKDSKGTTYMIQVAYSESMIVVSLITWD